MAEGCRKPGVDKPRSPQFHPVLSLENGEEFYLKKGAVPWKKFSIFKTPETIVGDIYPLSSRDHNDTLSNPYNPKLAPESKYYSARVRNVLAIEHMAYGATPGSVAGNTLGSLRVEVNKCSPIPWHSWVNNKTVSGMGESEAILRMYSNPEGDGAKVGEVDGYYIPSRFREEHALLKPKLSNLNMLFTNNDGILQVLLAIPTLRECKAPLPQHAPPFTTSTLSGRPEQLYSLPKVSTCLGLESPVSLQLSS